MTFYFKPFMVLTAIFLFASSTTIAQKRKVAKKQARTATSNELIKNGIILQSRGFKVAEAYLVFDDENLVPEGNKVAVQQNVNMLLIIDSGWTDNNGRVYPGSKQVLKLNTGAEILTQEELFAAFDETGVAADDARYITLNTSIPELKDKKKHVVVNFRLWDKKGSSEITGHYKLYVK